MYTYVPVQHGVRTDHIWFALRITQHALNSLQNQFDQIIMNRLLEKSAGIFRGKQILEMKL